MDWTKISCSFGEVVLIELFKIKEELQKFKVWNIETSH